MFFQTDYFTFASHYAPAEIVERLTASVDSDEVRFGFVAPFSRAQFIGQITPSFIRLRLNNNKLTTNAFQLVLTAAIEPTSTGSILHCRIGLYPVSIAMLGLGAILFPLLAFCLIGSAISAALEERNYWTALGPGLFFLLLITSFVLGGWHASHGERDRLRTFVLTELARSEFD